MDGTGKKSQPLNFYVSADTHERLKTMAAENDRSMSAEVRRAIEERLERHESSKAGAAA